MNQSLRCLLVGCMLLWQTMGRCTADTTTPTTLSAPLGETVSESPSVEKSWNTVLEDASTSDLADMLVTHALAKYNVGRITEDDLVRQIDVATDLLVLEAELGNKSHRITDALSWRVGLLAKHVETAEEMCAAGRLGPANVVLIGHALARARAQLAGNRKDRKAELQWREVEVRKAQELRKLVDESVAVGRARRSDATDAAFMEMEGRVTLARLQGLKKEAIAALRDNVAHQTTVTQFILEMSRVGAVTATEAATASATLANAQVALAIELEDRRLLGEVLRSQVELLDHVCAAEMERFRVGMTTCFTLVRRLVWKAEARRALARFDRNKKAEAAARRSLLEELGNLEGSVREQIERGRMSPEELLAVRCMLRRQQLQMDKEKLRDRQSAGRATEQ